MKVLATHSLLSHDSRREIVGILYRGSPRVSGPLVRQSCLAAQTAAFGGLRAGIAGIGDLSYGPALQGHDCLQAANRVMAATFFKVGQMREINHDQIKSFIIFLKARAIFAFRKFARDFRAFCRASLESSGSLASPSPRPQEKAA